MFGLQHTLSNWRVRRALTERANEITQMAVAHYASPLEVMRSAGGGIVWKFSPLYTFRSRDIDCAGDKYLCKKEFYVSGLRFTFLKREYPKSSGFKLTQIYSFNRGAGQKNFYLDPYKTVGAVDVPERLMKNPYFTAIDALEIWCDRWAKEIYRESKSEF